MDESTIIVAGNYLTKTVVVVVVEKVLSWNTLALVHLSRKRHLHIVHIVGAGV